MRYFFVRFASTSIFFLFGIIFLLFYYFYQHLIFGQSFFSATHDYFEMKSWLFLRFCHSTFKLLTDTDVKLKLNSTEKYSCQCYILIILVNSILTTYIYNAEVYFNSRNKHSWKFGTHFLLLLMLFFYLFSSSTEFTIN